jgi:hypothetical protein
MPETLPVAADSFCCPVSGFRLIHKGFSDQRTVAETPVPLASFTARRPVRSGQVVHSNDRRIDACLEIGNVHRPLPQQSAPAGELFVAVGNEY